MSEANQPFNIIEATIGSVHSAYRSGQLTARRLVQLYLDRIETYDKKGPAINAIITINPLAIGEAERLDAVFERSGFVGPLHGIPVIMKDQGDAKGMPTTLGSVLFKDYYPQRDAFVVERLKRAGAVILAKATAADGTVFLVVVLELDLRHAPDRRVGQSQRSLRRMAIAGRIPRTDDPCSGRSRQTARCHGRLRRGRSSHGPGCWTGPGKLRKFPR